MSLKPRVPEAVPLEPVRKKIWSQLLYSTSFWLPSSIAAASGIGAIFVGGVLGWIAVGAGAVATAILIGRIAFGFDQLQTKAEKQIVLEKWAAQEKRLDALQLALRSDRDHRTKDALALARQTRGDLATFLEGKHWSGRVTEMVPQMEQLFWAAIEQLEHSLKLYESADRLAGGQRDEILQEREKLIEETQAAVDRMREVAKHFRNVSLQESELNLQPLQEELDASLRIAKRTEMRMRELEAGPDDKDFMRQ